MASHLTRGLHAYRAHREGRLPRPTDIHVAVCVADMKTARRIKNSTAVITPANWKGTAVLHVLVGNATEIDDQMRVLLASLRLFNPRDLDLIYPVEMEIGWNPDLSPKSTTARSSSTTAA